MHVSPYFLTRLEPLPSSVLPYPSFSYEYQIRSEMTDLPSRLPERLRLVNTATQLSVVCDYGSIAKGSRFGPYQGREVKPSEIREGEDNAFMWEVCTVIYVYIDSAKHDELSHRSRLGIGHILKLI